MQTLVGIRRRSYGLLPVKWQTDACDSGCPAGADQKGIVVVREGRADAAAVSGEFPGKRRASSIGTGA